MLLELFKQIDLVFISNESFFQLDSLEMIYHLKPKDDFRYIKILLFQCELFFLPFVHKK